VSVPLPMCMHTTVPVSAHPRRTDPSGRVDTRQVQVGRQLAEGHCAHPARALRRTRRRELGVPQRDQAQRINDRPSRRTTGPPSSRYRPAREQRSSRSFPRGRSVAEPGVVRKTSAPRTRERVVGDPVAGSSNPSASGRRETVEADLIGRVAAAAMSRSPSTCDLVEPPSDVRALGARSST